MLKLLAFAPEDGWAFIERGKELFVTRPPYWNSTTSTVSATMIEKAIRDYGFTRASTVFDDWESLVTHLKGEIVRCGDHRKIPEIDEQVRNLLNRAPAEVISKFLERIRGEFFVANLDAAKKAIVFILSLKVVQENDVLRADSLRLLEELLSKIHSRQEIVRQGAQEELQKRYREVFVRYGNQVEDAIDRVREHGFQFGGCS